MKLSNKVKLQIAVVSLAIAAVLMFIGNPDLSGKNDFSVSELEESKNIGAELSFLMGQVSLSQSNCADALGKLAAVKGRISTLTEKLFSLDAEYVAELDYRSVTDLLEASNWIEGKCKTE